MSVTGTVVSLILIESTANETIKAMTPSINVTITMLLLAALTSGSDSWLMVQQRWARSTTFKSSTRLSVLSAPDQQGQVAVPYIVARGDGSTGGGGLPMPHESENGGSGLARPKVGVEMPKGRPSWFKVPAPSQGVFLFNEDMLPLVWFP